MDSIEGIICPRLVEGRLIVTVMDEAEVAIFSLLRNLNHLRLPPPVVTRIDKTIQLFWTTLHLTDVQAVLTTEGTASSR